MNRHQAGFDWLIFTAIAALLLLSLLVLKSIAPGLFWSQVTYAFLGLFLFFLFSRIDYRMYDRLAWIIAGFSLILLTATYLFGAVTRGAVRWLQIGSLTFQPSELVKPFLILFFAWFFSSNELNWKKIFSGILLLSGPVFLIFWQPDLGNSIVIILVWLGILGGAGISWRWLFLGAPTIIFSFPLVWEFLKDYQRQRIYTFLNPMADPLKSGYHVIQSMVAVGSGQLLGRGLGQGPQSHLRFLPERHTDFIFASLSEELGFAGSAILLIFLLILLWRILKVARGVDDRFGFLTAVGVFSLIFSQSLINIGMNLGLLPITGITLPLISSGGSSLVAVLISLGIVENIAGFAKEDRL